VPASRSASWLFGALLALSALVGTAGLLAVVIMREPDVGSIAAFLAFFVLVAFAAAAAILYYLPRRIAGTRRRPRTLPVMRRGGIVAFGLGLLALLRVIDALTPMTAAFVLVALATLEGFLSARG
jgi:hypothetical protein